MMKLNQIITGQYRYCLILTIFEQLIYKRMKVFIDEKDILCRSQYGFREEHSTQHAIIDIVNILFRVIWTNVYFRVGFFL